MVTVVDRGGPLFAATFNVTVPLPLPDAAPATVTHVGSLLTAVQPHQPPAVTVTAIEPPAAGSAWLVGEMP
jgi:hypothetical protein